MSIIVDWQESLLKDFTLKSNSKYIAMYLRTFMNAKSDMAWPSLTRIVGETGLSKATVCRHLDNLENSGWISRNRGTVGKNTEYIAVLPSRIKGQLGSLTVGLSGEEVVSPRDRGSLTMRQEVVSPRDTNNQVNNQVITNSDFDAKFEQFWSVYPVKKSKKSARLKFVKLKPDIQDKAIANVKTRAKHDPQWLSGYAPHPATYVNGECWDDVWKKDKAKTNGRANPNQLVEGVDY